MEDTDWPDENWDVSESMEAQEEIQRKIEAYVQIDEDVKNGIKPF